MGVLSSMQRALPDLRAAFAPDRLLLVVKTALAVGIAWAIAPLMPGVTDEYPYYAPLGALVSMYPTLMSSLKSSVQTMLGLAVGIGVAVAVAATVGPNWWSIPLAVGVGLLVSRFSWFGAGRDYVPMAALFVLIVGGGDADDYSLGYVVQMGVGIVVGLVINLVIAPPLSTGAARSSLRGLQADLAEQLRQIAAAVAEDWPPEHASWSDRMASLMQLTSDVRASLVSADESRKGNPRAWRRQTDLGDAYERLETLEQITHQIREISGALTDAIWERPGFLAFDSSMKEPTSKACSAVADAVAKYGSFDEEQDDDAWSKVVKRAEGAVARLVEAAAERTAIAQTVLGPSVVTAIALRRICTLLRA